MAEALVTDWLADYSSLQPSEIRTFAAQHEHNHEIASALYTILNERTKFSDLLHPICNQFYSFYCSNEIELRRFTLQFVPLLIYIYLNSVSQGDKRNCRSVETLLISIYNIEISNDDDGQPKVVSFRMPVLAQPSIYHEEKSLHASDLRRWEENSNKDVNWGPLPQVESLNAQNRLKVMTALMFVYNQQLSQIQKPALYHLCRTATQLVNQGFTKMGHAHRSSYGNDPNSTSMISKPLIRIPMSSQFLLELLHAVYFSMFNEFASVAIQTLEDIHNRACFELFPDVILVTNAVRNSLHANPSGQPSDGPMGISVALTPATTTVTVSKSMITNASFRAKKLPDDIPIQDSKDDNAASALLSITEESENEPQLINRNTGIRSSKENPKTHKVPFPAFTKKLKENKDKDKDKDKEKDGKNKNINGNLSLDNKELSISSSSSTTASLVTTSTTPTSKKSILKDRLTTRNSLQMVTMTTATSATGDGGDLDKNSLSMLKPKSTSLDIANGPISGDLISMTNGKNSINDEKAIQADSHNNSLETSESIDSGTDISSIGPQRPSLVVMDIKQHGNIQVSQV